MTLGLRFDKARFLPMSDGAGVWVSEGNGVACLSSARNGATACDTSVNAWKKGLLLEVYKAGKSPARRPTGFRAIGVVPNWAGAVEAKIRGKTKITQTLSGAYEIRAPVPIKSIIPIL